MTTWTQVSNQSTDFAPGADAINGYVVVGYLANGYIGGSPVWSAVDAAATSWVVQ